MIGERGLTIDRLGSVVPPQIRTTLVRRHPRRTKVSKSQG